MSEILLEVTDLKLYYPTTIKSKTGLFGEKASVKAVDGVSFKVYKGETFGIVGESGCGKSTTGHVLVGLKKPTAGVVQYEGCDIFAEGKKANWAQKIQIIFQDPYSSLDPRFTVGRSIGEPLLVQKICSRVERKDKVLKLMKDVGLSPEHYTKYPHEFSGGQRQRIGVARALVLNPSLIICDEPVSALDVSIQSQILNLMKELQNKYSLTYIFVSHNLAVVNHVCDRIAVMYLGNIVEIANKKDLFNNPQHPYTKALLAAIPIPDPDRISMQGVLEGDVPSPLNPPTGCCFHTRCPFAIERCENQKPMLEMVEEDHFTACHMCETRKGY